MTTTTAEKIKARCLISECKDVEFLRDAVEKLWAIIDDIDSYGDMAKSDDKFYRNRVERRQAMRWVETDIGSDGYEIYRKINPPEPEYRHGDSIKVLIDNEFWSEGIYLHRVGEGNRHKVSTELSGLLCRESHEIRPAPYRIRLRPDDGVDPKQLVLSVEQYGRFYKLQCEGMSAQVEIIND